MARALDLLGDRWTLMILRDLCSGPWRFSDLLAGLGGIGPNLLSARLALLVEQGLVAHRENRYQLSGRGQAVRPLMRELMVFGKVLGGPGLDDDRTVPARTAMGVLFDPIAARGQSLNVSVKVEQEQFAMLVADGALTFVSGPSPVAADVTLEATREAFEAAGRGESNGNFHLRGHASALQCFRQLFSLPVDRLQRLME